VLELKIVEGADAGQQFTVDGPRVTIGRGKPRPGQTGAIFLHDTTVSSEQASIHTDDRGSLLEHNPRATNPTLVNDRKVRRHRLRPDDQIRIGRVVIDVHERSGIALSGLFSSSEVETEPLVAPTALSPPIPAPQAAAREIRSASAGRSGRTEPDPNATTLDPRSFQPREPDISAGATQVRATATPSSRGRLTLVRGISELTNATFPLLGNSSIIGRSKTCDISIPEPGISRQHCRVEWEAGAPYIVHLSQTNSTIVNGAAIDGRRKLLDGDEVQLADQVTLRVDLGSTDAVDVPATEQPTLPPESRDRSLRAYMEEKIERDRMIEEEFSVEGSFLDVDVVGSYQMKAQTSRPPEHIIVSFERFRGFVGGVIEEFGGQVLNSNGDELMCFFEDTLQSVRSASAILSRLDDFNARMNVLESPFRFRIGVHTGTSLVDRARGVAYSPVLDVAGHLQKDAEINGLLISEATLLALPDGLPFESAGQLEDGGIPVYRLSKPIE
jgi:pSer/pThr/pTyr-binding forkhead associated (FHA) protein